MTFKEWMQRRIEKDAVVSYLDNEKVILKKSRIPIIGGDWRQIHPPINEKGKTNWVNVIFGGKRNLVILVVILIIVGMVLFQFHEIFNYISELQNHPCYPAFETCIKNSP